MFAPRKILIIKFRAMGDTILMTAPLAELKRAYPHAEIQAAVLTPWAPLLEHHPALSRIWKYDRHADRASRAKAIARLALKLRREKFDCVVNFHASPSSATLAFATGARVRSIHFHGHKSKNRYSTVVVPGKGTLKPIIERDMDAVRALGVDVPVGRLPTLELRDWEIAEAAERAFLMNLKAPLLGIGIGASRPSKSWPVERYATLAVNWARTTGGSALAFAGSTEMDLANEFLKQVNEALVAAVPEIEERPALRARIACEAGSPIRKAASMISRCSVFVGNDSGPRHMAVALKVPTVTLFGPEDPFEWHPYPKDLHPYLFVEGLACRKDAMPGMPPWCGLETCLEEQHRCMRQIGIEQVLSECRMVAR